MYFLFIILEASSATMLLYLTNTHHLGGIATFEKLYRLRHVATGKYLTAEEDDSISQSRSAMARTQPKMSTSVPQLSLATIMEESSSKTIKLTTCDGPNSPNTLFTFHPITLGSSVAENVKFGSFVRIRHHKSQCWLHAEQEILCTRKGEEESLSVSPESYGHNV